MMTGYLDDSYDNATVVSGGWVAEDGIWDVIQDKWNARVRHETAMSLLKGLKPVTRYHASDCANRVNDFEGWSVQRQIIFVKRLVEIMTQHPLHRKPMIFSWGLSLSEFRAVSGPREASDLLKEGYAICALECFRNIAQMMQTYRPGERVTFMHDSGPLFAPALRAFSQVKHDGADQFVTLAPMDWRDCSMLQPADMVAYDSFKVINRRLHDDPLAVRKSLEELVGRKTPIICGYLKPGAFAEMFETMK